MIVWLDVMPVDILNTILCIMHISFNTSNHSDNRFNDLNNDRAHIKQPTVLILLETEWEIWNSSMTIKYL